ncbi:MAG TPA: hypothetical protein VNN07_05820 [Candidatus Tectomicrobia bacterium]|nr:hypothetical protein [Candidatus Tectomicrobia bacterium]
MANRSNGARTPSAARGAPDAVPLDGLLEELGFTTVSARSEARRALEDAGLTNARKSKIHPRKRAEVERVLAERFVRVCRTAGCAEAASGDERRHVSVTQAGCEMCGGSATRRAIARMVAAMTAAGLTRLLVVGGAPGPHEVLRSSLRDSAVKLDIVEGDRAPDPNRIRGLSRNADITVIWGSTILPHKVSRHADGADAITVSRRGVEALADGVRAHAERRMSGR